MNAVLKSLGVGSVEALLKAVVYLVICLIVTKVIMSAVRKLLDKKVNMEPALRKFVASGIKALLVVVTIAGCVAPHGRNQSFLFIIAQRVSRQPRSRRSLLDVHILSAPFCGDYKGLSTLQVKRRFAEACVLP